MIKAGYPVGVVRHVGRKLVANRKALIEHVAGMGIEAAATAD